jgi:VIT1/CCC1 family predicted Fe2+/Mn2+ transporter
MMTERLSSPRLISDRPARPIRSKRSETVSRPGVVEQVRLALRPKARLATLLGTMLGGFVPLASYVVAHHEIDPADPLTSHSLVCLFLVLGGLAYSAKTVWQWGRIAFQNAFKALGFVVLLEGVMVTSHILWLSIAALVYLMAINGIATGCTLSLERRS